MIVPSSPRPNAIGIASVALSPPARAIVVPTQPAKPASAGRLPPAEMKPRYGTLMAAPMSVPWAGSPRIRPTRNPATSGRYSVKKASPKSHGLLAR
jgi:hypothetical protein